MRSPAVGVEALECVECFDAALDVGHDFELGLAAEEGPQPAADDSVVIDDQHPDRAVFGPHAGAFVDSGVSTLTTVPTPAELEMSSSAPMSLARPRIDSSP